MGLSRKQNVSVLARVLLMNLSAGIWNEKFYSENHTEMATDLSVPLTD